MKKIVFAIALTAALNAQAEDRVLMGKVQKQVNAMAEIAGKDHSEACSASLYAAGFGSASPVRAEIFEKCLAHLDDEEVARGSLDSNVAEIKAGRRKPANLDEAIKVYDALNGYP